MRKAFLSLIPKSSAITGNYHTAFLLACSCGGEGSHWSHKQQTSGTLQQSTDRRVRPLYTKLLGRFWEPKGEHDPVPALGRKSIHRELWKEAERNKGCKRRTSGQRDQMNGRKKGGLHGQGDDFRSGSSYRGWVEFWKGGGRMKGENCISKGGRSAQGVFMAEWDKEEIWQLINNSLTISPSTLIIKEYIKMPLSQRFCFSENLLARTRWNRLSSTLLVGIKWVQRFWKAILSSLKTFLPLDLIILFQGKWPTQNNLNYRD